MTTTRNTTSGARPLLRGRVAVLAAILLTALNLRTSVTGFTPVIRDAQTVLHFGPATAGIVGTLVTLCFAVFALLAPLVARLVGLERTAVLALTFTTVGVVLCSLAPSTGVLIAATLVAFAGVGTSNVIVIPLVKEYFGDRLKTLSTTYMFALQFGQFMAPLLAVPLAVSFGWRIAIGAWSITMAVAWLLWIIVAIRARHVAGAERVAAEKYTDVITEEPRFLWRSSYLWGLVLLMGMTALHTYAIVTWLPSMFQDAGLSATNSAILLSLATVTGLAGALIVPGLVLRMKNAYVVVVCTALLVIGYTGMLVATRQGAIIWALALGLGINTFPLCLTLISARARTSREATSTAGVVQGISYFIGCAGPLILGILNQNTGSWNDAYVFLLATLVITLVSGWFATRPLRTPRVNVTHDVGDLSEAIRPALRKDLA
jgi:CP family cyanate transporter-like MFS transporter